MQKSSTILRATLLLIAVNLAIGGYFLLRKPAKISPEIATPMIAVERLQAKSLYFTPQARACLIADAPQILSPDDKDAQSERSIAFAQAAQNPGLWRRLDRQYHFDTILLSGDPATYYPLLQHLLESGDWTLTYLDHTSLIFQRPPAKPWMPANMETLRRKFNAYPVRDQVIFLSQLAGKLSAVTQFTQAKHCIDDAMKLDPKSPEAQTELALYHAHFSQWKEVLAITDAVLAKNKNYRPALETRAQALLATKRFEEALKASDHLMELAPKDPSVLFLHAKIAHENHAYSREVSALQSLIEQTLKLNRSVSGFRIYLGQAFEANGAALPALEQFQGALNAGDLSPEQKKFVRESIERIKSRM